MDETWIADPHADAAMVAALRHAWAAERGTISEDAAIGSDFVNRVRQWWIGDQRTIVFVGDRQFNGVAGMVSLHEYRRMPMPGIEDSAWGYVGHLFVFPAARRKGFGAALISAVQREARRRDYRRLVLSPTTESVPLYRRSGFRAADELMVWTPSTSS